MTKAIRNGCPGTDPLEPTEEVIQERVKQKEQQGQLRRIQANMELYGIREPWTSQQLNEARIEHTYLVDGVLVESQAAVIAGASKTLKTSIAIDLAISLGVARKCLGTHWVPESKRVLFLSAESGEATIQETARRVAWSKGISLEEASNIHWGFWVPKAKNDEQIEILKHQLETTATDVCIIDPLYQVLDGEDAANLSMNGQQMRVVTQVCLDRCVTPVLIDHVKRSSINAQQYRPLELHDISGAGKAEFFRQWVLLSRREPFDPETQFHRLWMNVGGSAGHCGSWAVDIDESRDEATERRQWLVDVEPASEARAADAEQRERQKQEEQESRRRRRIRRDIERIRDAFPNQMDRVSKSRLRERTGLKLQPLNEALAVLLQDGELECGKHKGPTGPEHDAYWWTRKASHIRR